MRSRLGKKAHHRGVFHPWNFFQLVTTCPQRHRKQIAVHVPHQKCSVAASGKGAHCPAIQCRSKTRCGNEGRGAGTVSSCSTQQPWLPSSPATAAPATMRPVLVCGISPRRTRRPRPRFRCTAVSSGSKSSLLTASGYSRRTRSGSDGARLTCSARGFASAVTGRSSSAGPVFRAWLVRMA